MGKYIREDALQEQRRAKIETIPYVQEKLERWANKVIVGYEGKPTEQHKEGDVWEENDKTWTIKNGIKQTVDKLQYAKTPWFCPKCGRVMNHPLHDKFYRIRGACFDCVIDWEGKMRVGGVWPTYEKKLLRENEKSWLEDQIQRERSIIDEFTEPQIHFENGGWEKLATKEQFVSWFETVAKDIETLRGRLSQIKKEEKEDANEYQKLDEWLLQNPWTTQPTRADGSQKS